MGMTGFRPEVEGFAFSNAWRFDDHEKAQIATIMNAALQPLGGVAVGLLGPLVPLLDPVTAGVLTGTFIDYASHAVARGLNDVYGR